APVSPIAARRPPTSWWIIEPMGYTGAATLADFRDRATFVKISSAALRESHVHDVTITRESPNYPGALS
ncbi:IMP dehydrogenase, partial [Roseibium sp.]|uniref:IMP dehydrogenase n=1 Tax=Roseibium sp. TaxID=1936156 RepID=UPI0035167AF7